MKLPNYARRVLDVPKDVAQHVQAVYEDIFRVVNGRIHYGSPTGGRENIDGVWFTGTVAAAATDLIITHNLGRIPVGWHTFKLSQAAILYAGGAVWTNTTLSLQANVAPVNITIFIT